MDSDDVLHCNHNKLCTSVTTAYCFMFPPINANQPPSLYKFLSKGGSLFVFLHESDQRFQCFTKINIASQPWNISFCQEVKGFLLFNINQTKDFLVLHQILKLSANSEISVLRVNMQVSCQYVADCCEASLPRFRWQLL